MTKAPQTSDGGFFDAHVHLTDPRAADHAAEIIALHAEQGIGRFLLGGFDSEDWARQDTLRDQFPDKIFMCAGVHPWVVARNSREFGLAELAKLEARLADPVLRPAAIGEVGIDLSHGSLVRARDDQMAVVRAQLDLARTHQLPVILHCVKGNSRLIQELRRVRDDIPGALVHGFAGDPVFARELVDLKVLVSMGPRSMAKVAPDVLAMIPDELVAIESDAPLVAPREGGPAHGCDPRYLLAVADWLAEERAMTRDELLALSTQNVERLLGLESTQNVTHKRAADTEEE